MSADGDEPILRNAIHEACNYLHAHLTGVMGFDGARMSLPRAARRPATSHGASARASRAIWAVVGGRVPRPRADCTR
jgi:hypothetical protein